MQAAVSSDAFSDGHVSTIAHLTGEKLQGHRFAWPPAEEQRAIVEQIDGEAAASDASIERAARRSTFSASFAPASRPTS